MKFFKIFLFLVPLFFSYLISAAENEKNQFFKKALDSLVIYKKFERYHDEILNKIKQNHRNIPSEKFTTFLRTAEKNFGQKKYTNELAQSLSLKLTEKQMSQISEHFKHPSIQKLIETLIKNNELLDKIQNPEEMINIAIEKMKTSGEINDRLTLVRYIDTELFFESDLAIKDEIYSEIRNDFGVGIDVFSIDYKKQIAKKYTELLKLKTKTEQNLLFCTKDLTKEEIKATSDILNKPELSSFFKHVKQTVFNLRNKSEGDFLLEYKTHHPIQR
jgi:hypothetical protein